MPDITDKLAEALRTLLSLNRTQGVEDVTYEVAEASADAALAEYDGLRAAEARSKAFRTLPNDFETGDY